MTNPPRFNWCVTRPIPGYEDLYGATEDGKIWSYPKEWITGANKILIGHQGKFLKSALSGSGSKRLVVLLRKNKKSKMMYVHRLIAMTFIPNKLNLPQINHINGDHFDNHVSNLEWCTNQENCDHAWKTGLMPRGEKKYNAKLTWNLVKEIRAKYIPKSETSNYYTLAEKYKVNFSTIRNIIKQYSWKI